MKTLTLKPLSISSRIILCLIPYSLFLIPHFSSAQIAINNSATNPDASAILDLNTGNAGVNKGFLAPQVALTNVTTALPVTGPATGLMVYSTSAPTGGNGTGYYYWNGTAWTGLGSSLNGAGINNYVARWTPNGNTLGTGLIQDNNTNVGVNNAPVVGTMLSVNGGTSNNGINALSSYTLAGSYAVHGNSITGNDAYLGYIGPITAATIMDTDAAGYFSASSGKGSALVVTTTGTNENVAVLGLSNNWSGGLFVTGYGSASGVVGYNDSTEHTSTGDGVDGYTAQGSGFAVFGQNLFGKTNTGVGIFGIGSAGLGEYFTLGEGVMGEGEDIGVAGYADTTVASVTAAGGYFEDGHGSYAYVGTTVGGTNYKVGGNGTVATIVKDQNNKNITLFCPEAPEVLFEDYGQATLASGKVHVNLDPDFSKNVAVNDKHPLRVIITMNDPCPNTIYVTNRTASGFDVIENNNGTSNASFTYEVIANRADDINPDGSTLSKFADVRFPEGPSPLAKKMAANKKNTISAEK